MINGDLTLELDDKQFIPHLDSTNKLDKFRIS